MTVRVRVEIDLAIYKQNSSGQRSRVEVHFSCAARGAIAAECESIQAQPTASRKSYWHMHTNQRTGQCWPHPKHRSLLVTNCANSNIKERRSLECHSTHPRLGSTSQTVATRYLGDVLRTSYSTGHKAAQPASRQGNGAIRRSKGSAKFPLKWSTSSVGLSNNSLALHPCMPLSYCSRSIAVHLEHLSD
jgi:hypothetical protein